MSGAFSPLVVVASSDQRLLDDLIRYLEEIPQWRLVASVTSITELLEAIALHSPDTLLISDSMASELASARPDSLSDLVTVVVGRQESAAAFKGALGIGARGFVTFPNDASAILQLVEGHSARTRVRPQTGAISMLWAPKGGSGTSVIAAHLAGALARLGTRSILCDLDIDHGDQTSLLGANAASRTILELVRVKDELSPATIESVAFIHPLGFRALLSPGHPGESGLVKSSDLVRTVAAVRDLTGHVVVDLPSGYSETMLALSEEARRFLIVVTPDVLSLRRTRDALPLIRGSGMEEARIDFVVNRYVSGTISAADIGAVVGKDPIASIRLDAGLERSSDRGELSEVGIRLLEPLASDLLGLRHERRPPRKSLLRRR